MTRKSDPVLRDLFACVTAIEASERWNVHYNTVMAAIDRGKLDCRRSGTVWLITTESLIRYWGKPEAPNLDSVLLTLPRWRRVA